MKKLDNFSNSLEGQFNLTFELAWKALQEILRIHGAVGADTGLPRENSSKILKNEIKTVAIRYEWSIINIKDNSISKLEI
jgi:hypothetical protein